MRFIKTTITTLTVGLMLVVGFDYVALAATGQSLVLGKINKANQPTTVKNTGNGPAAKFVADDAPIAVSNDKLIKKLNADEVDGKSAADLGVSTRLYKTDFFLQDVSGFQMFINDVPAGNYMGSIGGYFFGSNDGGWIDCVVLGTQAPVGEWMPSRIMADAPEPFYTWTGADVLVVAKKQDLIARCTGSTADWSGDLRFGLTRINQLKQTKVTTGPA